MANCKNCNQEVSGKFCSNCGQPTEIKRLSKNYIVHEIEHVLHLEKGILYTIRELLLKPGATVRYFIKENRSRLVKPIIFIIVTSLIYTIVNSFFKIEEQYIEMKGMENSSIGTMFSWMQNHYGYANIVLGVFIAYWLKIFFKKYEYNFFEILVLLCFVIGIGMLIYAVFGIMEGITHIKMMTISGILGFAYVTWAIAQFFDSNKIANYFKAIVAYLLGMLTAIILVMIVGLLIDLAIK